MDDSYGSYRVFSQNSRERAENSLKQGKTDQKWPSLTFIDLKLHFRPKNVLKSRFLTQKRPQMTFFTPKYDIF